MQVCVTTEYCFDSTPDGAVWTQTSYPYSFWARYLVVFDHVCVIARVRPVPAVPSGWYRADGEGVSFAPIPYYLGPWQYLVRAWPIRRAAINPVGSKDAVLLRVPSQIANCMEPFLYHTGHVYGIEAIGDPYYVFAPGAARHTLRPFFRWWFTSHMRQQCRRACATTYVTQDALQRRYPPVSNAFTAPCSDIELPETAFVSAPRPVRQGSEMLTLITVGSLAQLYKGPNVLIEAVALCIRNGLSLRLVILGDGKHRAELEARAIVLGIRDGISFPGQIPAGEPVRAYLDRADLFVLPSRTEGLPKAMIEAMARALPCIGSTVGGIPELLPSEDMVPPGDVAALTQKIREVVSDPPRMARMSERNLKRAIGYHDGILTERRVGFYRYVKERTEEWLKTTGK